ncbi:unnamed protein product [Pleuronectes platessa]|uniref:Uncharacterized protein n=1 Tax=Pleuronectes platessa TaxID=8262 RepID=A0A9N7TS03_PLEPL|nr:unnamed protein product [Pleuronectes platessa]
MNFEETGKIKSPKKINALVPVRFKSRFKRPDILKASSSAWRHLFIPSSVLDAGVSVHFACFLKAIPSLAEMLSSSSFSSSSLPRSLSEQIALDDASRRRDEKGGSERDRQQGKSQVRGGLNLFTPSTVDFEV